MKNRTLNLLKQYKYYIVLIGIFIIRGVILKAKQIGFVSCSYDGMHMPDMQLLIKSPFSTIFYFHAQPPLLSMIYYFAYNSNNPIRFLHWFYTFLALLSFLAIYRGMCILKINGLTACIATGLFMLLPNVILYQFWGLYTFLIMSFVTFSAWAILEWLYSHKRLYLVLFFASIMLLTLLRTYFHPFIFFLLIAIMVIYFKKKRREIILWGSVFALLPLLLVLKNYYLFGLLSTSSWTGMNLFKTTRFAVDKRDIEEMVKKGKVSDILLRDYRFRFIAPDLLVNEKAYKPIGIPVLDMFRSSAGEPNYNHISIIPYSKTLLKDEIKLFMEYPLSIYKPFIEALYLYFMPSEHEARSLNFKPSKHFGYREEMNTSKIPTYVAFYRNYICGRITIKAKEEEKKDMSMVTKSDRLYYINIIIAYIAFFLLAFWYSFKKQSNNEIDLKFFFIYALFLVLFITMITSLTELGENKRFRFPTESIVLIVLTLGIQNTCLLVRQYLKKKPKA